MSTRKAQPIDGWDPVAKYAQDHGMSQNMVRIKIKRWEAGDHHNGLHGEKINGVMYVQVKPGAINPEHCATDCFAYGSPCANGCRALKEMDCVVDGHGKPHCAFYKNEREERSA